MSSSVAISTTGKAMCVLLLDSGAHQDRSRRLFLVLSFRSSFLSLVSSVQPQQQPLPAASSAASASSAGSALFSSLIFCLFEQRQPASSAASASAAALQAASFFRSSFSSFSESPSFRFRASSLLSISVFQQVANG